MGLANGDLRYSVPLLKGIKYYYTARTGEFAIRLQTQLESALLFFQQMTQYVAPAKSLGFFFVPSEEIFAHFLYSLETERTNKAYRVIFPRS